MATSQSRGLDTRPAIVIDIPYRDGFRLVDLRAFIATADFAGMTEDERFELGFDADTYEVTSLRYVGRS